MKKLLALTILVLMLFSCKTKQLPPTVEHLRTEKDSTYVTLKVVDTIQVVRSADTARLSKPIQELTEIPTQIKSKHATVSISKIGNQIQAECYCDQLEAAVKLYKETITKQKQIIDQQKQTITLIQKEIPALLKPFLWIGIAVVIGILLIIAKKFLLPRLKLT